MRAIGLRRQFTQSSVGLCTCLRGEQKHTLEKRRHVAGLDRIPEAGTNFSETDRLVACGVVTRNLSQPPVADWANDGVFHRPSVGKSTQSGMSVALLSRALVLDENGASVP